MEFSRFSDLIEICLKLKTELKYKHELTTFKDIPFEIEFTYKSFLLFIII